MIFQDPYASLNPRWRVRDIVAEPIRAFGLVRGATAQRERVAELLTQVGLSPADGEKYPHEFSGGQRQRISIARALSSNPDFLVCDEPTSALDVSVQAQILNLMKGLQRDLGLTYLFISHNLAVVRQISDRIGVMYLGRIVELAPAETVFVSPRHPYTRALMDAIPDLEMIGRRRIPVGGEVPSPISPPPRLPLPPALPAGERPLPPRGPGTEAGARHAARPRSRATRWRRAGTPARPRCRRWSASGTRRRPRPERPARRRAGQRIGTTATALCGEPSTSLVLQARYTTTPRSSSMKRCTRVSLKNRLVSLS